eukprot:g33333.t1
MQSEAVKHVLSINQAIARKSRERSPTSKAKAKTSPKGHQASLTSLPKDGEIRIETGALKDLFTAPAPDFRDDSESEWSDCSLRVIVGHEMMMEPYPIASCCSSSAVRLERVQTWLRSQASLHHGDIVEHLHLTLEQSQVICCLILQQDLFKTTGWCQAIARNQLFKNMTMVVIVLNAIWIGIDTDLNTSDLEINSPLIFQVVDNFFCIFFSFEISVRFLAYQKSRDAFKDQS